jgi:hypothetical protein
VSETKIAATNRLRQEKRWEKASRYRNDQRRRLRAEGMKRRDAHEEAWRLMLKTFPPYDRDGNVHYLALGDFPPQCLPESCQPEITDVWRVYCLLMSFCCFVQGGLADANGGVVATLRRLRLEDPEMPRRKIPAEGTFRLHRWAFFTDPLGFLDLADATFQKTLERLEGDADDVEATRQELRSFLSGLPALRQAVRDHWSDEEQLKELQREFDLKHSRPQSEENSLRAGAGAREHNRLH